MGGEVEVEVGVGAMVRVDFRVLIKKGERCRKGEQCEGDGIIWDKWRYFDTKTMAFSSNKKNQTFADVPK